MKGIDKKRLRKGKRMLGQGHDAGPFDRYSGGGLLRIFGSEIYCGAIFLFTKPDPAGGAFLVLAEALCCFTGENRL